MERILCFSYNCNKRPYDVQIDLFASSSSHCPTYLSFLSPLIYRNSKTPLSKFNLLFISPYLSPAISLTIILIFTLVSSQYFKHNYFLPAKMVWYLFLYAKHPYKSHFLSFSHSLTSDLRHPQDVSHRDQKTQPRSLHSPLRFWHSSSNISLLARLTHRPSGHPLNYLRS